ARNTKGNGKSTITPGPARNVAPAPTANPIAIRSRFHERLGESVNSARALSIRYAPTPPMIQAAGPTRATTNSRGSTATKASRIRMSDPEADQTGKYRNFQTRPRTSDTRTSRIPQNSRRPLPPSPTTGAAAVRQKSLTFVGRRRSRSGGAQVQIDPERWRARPGDRGRPTVALRGR